MMWDKSSPGDSLLPGEVPEGKPGQKYGFDRPKWRFHGISPNFDWFCRWGILQDHNLTEDDTLVGGLEHFFIFPYIGNNHPNWRTPSFFRGVGIPPTSHILLLFCWQDRYHESEIYIGETNCCLACALDDVTTWWYERKAGKGKRLDFTTWFYDFVSVVKQAIHNSSRWIWGDSGIIMDRIFWVVHEGWGSPRKEAFLWLESGAISGHLGFSKLHYKTWRSGGENQILVDVDQEGLAIGEMLQDGRHFFLAHFSMAVVTAVDPHWVMPPYRWHLLQKD